MLRHEGRLFGNILGLCGAWGVTVLNRMMEWILHPVEDYIFTNTKWDLLLVHPITPYHKICEQLNKRPRRQNDHNGIYSLIKICCQLRM
jgi:hypothetical protein